MENVKNDIGSSGFQKNLKICIFMQKNLLIFKNWLKKKIAPKHTPIAGSSQLEVANPGLYKICVFTSF